MIELLKAEVSQLLRAVEASGAMAFTQDMSLDAIHSDVRALQQEIREQKDQFQALPKDMAAHRDETEEFVAKVAELSDE
jgi:septal ring factor EnvC (AmiA/AmiB activator)